MVFVGDPMITLPKSRPPTESREQVEDSKLLDRISKQTASVVFADGNAAWEAACLDRGLEHRPVTHQLKIFAAPCQTPGDLCNMAGTQCIDRTWLSLKGFLSQKRCFLKTKACISMRRPKSTCACMRFVRILWLCMDQTCSGPAQNRRMMEALKTTKATSYRYASIRRFSIVISPQCTKHWQAWGKKDVRRIEKYENTKAFYGPWT